MNCLMILWYDIINDYVFYDMRKRKFYEVSKSGRRYWLYYSPNMEFICEVV